MFCICDSKNLENFGLAKDLVEIVFHENDAETQEYSSNEDHQHKDECSSVNASAVMDGEDNQSQKGSEADKGEAVEALSTLVVAGATILASGASALVESTASQKEKKECQDKENCDGDNATADGLGDQKDINQASNANFANESYHHQENAFGSNVDNGEVLSNAELEKEKLEGSGVEEPASFPAMGEVLMEKPEDCVERESKMDTPCAQEIQSPAIKPRKSFWMILCGANSKTKQ